MTGGCMTGRMTGEEVRREVHLLVNRQEKMDGPMFHPDQQGSRRRLILLV